MDHTDGIEAEFLKGLEYDTMTGNYKAEEWVAVDYGDDAWQDESGQWWVDGNAVAETFSELRNRPVTVEVELPTSMADAIRRMGGGDLSEGIRKLLSRYEQEEVTE